MNFVHTMTTDTEVVEEPTWDSVRETIGALDGDVRTIVLLTPESPEGEHHMAIGGGLDDRCVVYITRDNLHFARLEDPSRDSEVSRFLMSAGGQEGDYRQAQCVPRAWAVQAAEHYFLLGLPAPGLPWRE